MGRKGTETRQQIMDTAQSMILERGYGGTSVDSVIKSMGLTKGAFFHHFNSKSDLAKALIQRYSDDGVQTFNETMERARKLSDDPLQQLLIAIGLYIEAFDGLTEPYEGCLLASYVYELQQFDADVRPIINSEMIHWRKALIPLIERIKSRYPPRTEIDSSALADMFLSTFEGAFVLSKALQEPQITADQLRLYKAFIETLFRS
ncbi:MAG: TetR/AcrR family transcriptional regulator [Gammaproteobacteria bacterium]